MQGVNGVIRMNEKQLMAEAATLYYEKKYTQQQIADLLHLTRQTVSRLLRDAENEHIVEIRIHSPAADCARLEQQLQDAFGLERAVVCSVSSRDEELRRLMTVRRAVDTILPLLEPAGQRIAVSWGRTVQELIASLPSLRTKGHVVFPLFGATDHENFCFSSNELARCLADKIGAAVKYAWFPYRLADDEESALFKKLSYYETMQALWSAADLAVVGIGDTAVLGLFEKTFGYSERKQEIIGDVATHFFNEKGEVVELYEHTLCASAEDLRRAKHTVGVACGDEKVRAIAGALKTGLLDVLITDEYTAAQVLEIG